MINECTVTTTVESETVRLDGIYIHPRYTQYLLRFKAKSNFLSTWIRCAQPLRKQDLMGSTLHLSQLQIFRLNDFLSSARACALSGNRGGRGGSEVNQPKHVVQISASRSGLVLRRGGSHGLPQHAGLRNLLR